MNDKPPIPALVARWIQTHKGSRYPVFSPGSFENFANSKTSACWGNHGGIDTGDGYKVAVCQPSPQRVGEKAVIFYDFIKV